MSMLLWSCGKEAEEMPDWDITLTPVNEAYSGETATVEVKVSKAVEIQLLVDGSLVQSTLGGSLVYDVSSLSVGNHTVKVSIDDGYGVYEKSFSCRIVAKSVMDNTNGKPNDNNPNDNNPNDNNPNDNNPEVLSYDYVDLGLPSGTLWATRNVGAENPWDYGDYFAWGETEPKEEYSSDTYTYNDNPSVLDAQHDAATANWGSDWCMPTQQQFQELKDNCTWKWTTRNGKNGCEVKGKNGNSIFFPATGYRLGTYLFSEGSEGNYWSSSFCSDNSNDWRDVWHFLYFYSGYVNPGEWCDGIYGQSVRAVRCK